MSEPGGRPLPPAEALRRFKDRAPRRGRRLLMLLLAVLAGFLLFFAIRPQIARQDDEASTQVVLIERDKTLLKSITVAIAGAEPYTLVNLNDYDLSDTNDVIGKEYGVEGLPDFAVSTAQVLPMERYASDLTAESVAARAPEDLAQFGLDPPALRVTIDYRDGAEEVLRFGGAVPTGSGYYLGTENDPAVYVAAESIYEAFYHPVSDLEQTEAEKASLAAAQAAETTAEP